ncbi:hypothetical protein CC86DRAFT_406844 [Ophiobolus disseminans]|uniref:Uncharacterized protein n=1 Tax=Ophiobolus disseminans TaxID=1469910 RepID=A0A6A6ZYQ3_9PLEO|nr:hypothetical protein CC86DRAFT_406844 [Ophiobolus disseminans]
MPSHYLPPAQQLPSSTPPSLNAPSSTHRHPSLQERITQLLNALIKYIKHLPNLAKSKKPKAVPVLRAEMLVPSPPNYSRPGSWDPQHIRMHTFASTEIPLPAAPTPSRASSMSFATLNAPGSTIASSNYSLALSTVMLAPTPPRKNTPPIPARNPRRLGGGGDTGENVMDARGSSVLVGAVGEGDGYGVTDRAGPSDPERYMHVHIEKLRRERKRWDGT